MNSPVCNVDLLVGERLTLQIDCYQKNRGFRLEKDKLDKLPETADSSVDQWARDNAVIFAGLVNAGS
jgi:Zn-finger nucleic acid-binding protein